MRIKTIRAILEEIKTIDNKSAITQGMLLELFHAKQIDCYYRGNRLVTNADKLPDSLNRIFGLAGNKTLPRIRSIHSAFVEIRQLYPELGVSEERIRSLIGLNEVPHVKIGNRIYLALESFEEPYNDWLMMDDYHEYEAAMLERIALEQLAQNLARNRGRHKSN